MTVYNKASLVLAESPAYKAGKIQPYYPLTPDVSFDFTRSTSATRVNASGNIEKETQNLLLQSNQFDTTWTTLNASVTSGQSGYDGSSDAWLLSITGGISDQRIYQAIQYSGVSTLSVFAKKNNSNWLSLRIGASVNKWYDLENGVLGGSTIVTDYIDASIEDYGNGWYRCSLTFKDNFNTTTRIYPADDNLVVTQTSGSIYIQDAQVEQGLVARNYQETTTAAFYGGITDNIPRLDYTDSSCPALLLEPQRTNLVTQSEYFDDATWVSNYTLTSNYTTSPDGGMNAYRVQVGTVNGYLREQISVSSSTDYVFSFYAKRGSATEMKYRVYDFTNTVDIVTNTSYYSQTSASDWVRIEVPFTTTATTASIGVYIDSDGQGNGDFLIWGAQVEEGSYATSYIPTYGTSVTRNGETANTVSIPSLIGQTEGTFFLDFEFLDGQTVENQNWIALESENGAERVLIYKSATTNNLRYYLNANGSVYISGSTIAVSPNTRYKVAVRYSNGDFAIYINGVKHREDNVTFTRGSDLSRVTFNESNILSSCRVHQVVVLKGVLSNDELAALTTL